METTVSKIVYRCDNLEPRILNMDWAVGLGINGALICQQILYWCNINRRKGINYQNGHYWTYNTFEDWHDQFPCLSLPTINRTVAQLEKENYIITGNYNKVKFDRTKWYRLNPEYFDFNDTPIARVGNKSGSIREDRWVREKMSEADWQFQKGGELAGTVAETNK